MTFDAILITLEIIGIIGSLILGIYLLRPVTPEERAAYRERIRQLNDALQARAQAEKRA